MDTSILTDCPVHTDHQVTEARQRFAVSLRAATAAWEQSLLPKDQQVAPALIAPDRPQHDLSSVAIASAEVSTAKPLGRYGKSASNIRALSEAGKKLQQKYMLQDAARRLLPGIKSIQGCHRWVGNNDKPVDMLSYPELGKARLTNIQSCSSVWMCPVCSGKICSRRCELELKPAIKRAYELGYYVLLVTYTLRHHSHQALRHLVDSLTTARKHSRSGCRLTKFRSKYGYVGSIRDYEITYGANGWHPHIHELLILESPYNRAELLADLRSQWADGIRLSGLGTVNDHGVKISEAHSKIEEYVTKYGKEPKWGLAEEVGRSPSKTGKINPETGEKGRSAFDLLAAYTVTGDIGAGILYQEYVGVMKGKRQLYWSPKLKLKLGVVQLTEQGKTDMTDAQIEALDVYDGLAVKCGSLSPAEYNLLRADDMVVHLLDVLKDADMDAVNELLTPYRSQNRPPVVQIVPQLIDSAADPRDRLLPVSDPFDHDQLVRHISPMLPDSPVSEVKKIAQRLYTRRDNGEDLPIMAIFRP